MPWPCSPWYMDQGLEAAIPAMLWQPLSCSAHVQFGGVGWLIGELSCGGQAAFLVVGLVVIHSKLMSHQIERSESQLGCVTESF